ncbi:MAG: hypothetical protein ACE5RI_07860 [Candidatus Nitrosomaritimum yanchengensis]
MDNPWLRRRWYDFRLGHSLYLIFALSFANFILIAHRLLIERVPILNEFFSSLWFFAIVFVLAYIPISIGIGIWHRRTQLRVEQDIAMRQNPIFAKAFATIIDIQTGKATPEQIENFRNTLKNIEENIKSNPKEE